MAHIKGIAEQLEDMVKESCLLLGCFILVVGGLIGLLHYLILSWIL